MNLPKVSELINEENGFIVKLRCNDEFCEYDYSKLKNVLKSNVTEWKAKGNVPVDDVVAIVGLIDQLAGGSRFFDEETAMKVEDACIEIEEILNDLIH